MTTELKRCPINGEYLEALSFTKNKYGRRNGEPVYYFPGRDGYITPKTCGSDCWLIFFRNHQIRPVTLRSELLNALHVLNVIDAPQAAEPPDA